MLRVRTWYWSVSSVLVLILALRVLTYPWYWCWGYWLDLGLGIETTVLARHRTWPTPCHAIRCSAGAGQHGRWVPPDTQRTPRNDWTARELVIADAEARPGRPRLSWGLITILISFCHVVSLSVKSGSSLLKKMHLPAHYLNSPLLSKKTTSYELR